MADIEALRDFLQLGPNPTNREILEAGGGLGSVIAFSTQMFMPGATWEIIPEQEIWFPAVREKLGHGIRRKLGNVPVLIKCSGRKEQGPDSVIVNLLTHAENIGQGTQLREKICAALGTSSEDLASIRDALIKVVFPSTLIADIIQRTLDKRVEWYESFATDFGMISLLGLGILAIVIWRAGVSFFCAGVD